MGYNYDCDSRTVSDFLHFWDRVLALAAKSGHGMLEKALEFWYSATGKLTFGLRFYQEVD